MIIHGIDKDGNSFVEECDHNLSFLEGLKNLFEVLNWNKTPSKRELFLGSKIEVSGFEFKCFVLSEKGWIGSTS